MKTATIQDLRYNFYKIEQWLRLGEEVEITRHSKPVAKLCPFGESAAATQVPLPDFTGRAKRIFGDHYFTQKKLTTCGLSRRGNRDCLSRVLHVATAVHLGAKEFLTFDRRQKKLAELIGLNVPL